MITGVIKANFPSRISYQVATKVDSRTILDTQGAEKLLGNGDMLFLVPGTSHIVRAQGAYVSDAEVNRVCGYLEQYPATRLSECESFLYWSKETYAWKPMITVTHVTILRGDGGRGAPEVVVTSRDVFATR